MTEKEKMHSCELYFPSDEEIMKEQTLCLEKLYDFNSTRPSESEKRTQLLKEMFAEIGDGCYIEPPLHANWGGHPLLPELRAKGYQYNAPVRIGKNCWLGAGVIIVPGVTIGDNVVIGAGSVVTKDIPDNVIAVGNPCKVLREISEHDKEYYFKDKKIDYSQIV